MGGGTGQYMVGDCVLLEMVAIDLMSSALYLQVCTVSLEPLHVMTSIFRISCHEELTFYHNVSPFTCMEHCRSI